MTVPRGSQSNKWLKCWFGGGLLTGGSRRLLEVSKCILTNANQLAVSFLGLDIAEAKVWYETQRSGLSPIGNLSRLPILEETPLTYPLWNIQTMFKLPAQKGRLKPFSLAIPLATKS